MTPRSCHSFWLWTRALDLITPGTGTRRIKERLQEKDEQLREKDESLTATQLRNSELTKECRFLRRELGRVQSDYNFLLLQDEVNTAFTNPSSRLPHLPNSKNTQDTAPPQAVN